MDVVVVNWNGGPELVASVTSALRFGGRPIVVDNASANTAALHDASQLAGVTVIRESRNTGFAAGCNTGAAAGTGDVVLLLNPDAEIVEGTAADLEHAFSDTQAMVIGTRLEDSAGQSVTPIRRAPGVADLVGDLLRTQSIRHYVARVVSGPSEPRPLPAGKDWIVGAAVAVRRTDWDRLGGLDPGFFLWYEDVDFCVRAVRAGGTLAVADTVLVRHVGASTWLRLPRRRRQWLRARGIWRYARRHLGWSGTAAVTLAVPAGLVVGIALDIVHWLARRP